MSEECSRSLNQPLNSASPDDKVTEGCVELHVLMTCCPIMTQPPLVDRSVLWHRDKAVSLYTSMPEADCHGYV